MRNCPKLWSICQSSPELGWHTNSRLTHWSGSVGNTEPPRHSTNGSETAGDSPEVWLSPTLTGSQ